MKPEISLSWAIRTGVLGRPRQLELTGKNTREGKSCTKKTPEFCGGSLLSLLQSTDYWTQIRKLPKPEKYYLKLSNLLCSYRDRKSLCSHHLSFKISYYGELGRVIQKGIASVGVTVLIPLNKTLKTMLLFGYSYTENNHSTHIF